MSFIVPFKPRASVAPHLLILLLVAAGLCAPAAEASRNAIERVSAGPSGGNGAFSAAIAGGLINDSIPPAMSEDGERLYFVTHESVTADDTDSAADLYQREDGVTTLVSDDTSGAPDAALDAQYVGISKDGTSVFFSTSEQLSPDAGSADGDGVPDIYVRDDGILRLLTVGGTGFHSFGGSNVDGSYVVFQSTEPLAGDDTDSQTEVYSRTLPSETFERISVGSTVGSGNGPHESGFSGMSRNGSRIFFSSAEQLDAGDMDAGVDIYERVPGSGTTNWVSQGNAAGSGNTGAAATFEWQSIDGAHAFFTTSESLAATDTDSEIDIYDRSGGVTTHVSQGAVNGNGPFTASFGRSSEDGALVFFTTKEQLAATDPDTAFDVYKRDLNTSITTNISGGGANVDAKLGGDQKCDGFVFPPCTQPPPGSAARSLQFDVSADGSRVFFETLENLRPNDTNGTSDVYERIGNTTLRVVSVTSSNQAGGFSYFAGAAADGSRAYFGTDRSLTPDDADGFAIDGYQRVGGVTILATIGALNDLVPDNGPFSISTTHATLARDGTRGYFQTTERLTADDTDSSEDVYFSETSDAITQNAPPGGSVSTGATPTSTDPLETDVTPPGGGSVTIEEQAPSVPAPSGYSLLGYQTTLTVSPNLLPTASSPIVLKFRIDSTLLPTGYDEQAPGCGQLPSQCIQVFKNGAQVASCLTPNNASPDPCVDERRQPGGAGTDIELEVLTLNASDWNFGLPNGNLVVVKDTVPDDEQDFGFTTDGGLSPPSFTLDDDSDGTLSNTQTFADVAPGEHYSVTETVPADWRQTSATCDDGSPASDIEITPGETVTCTFTNEPLGRIVVVKDATPDDPQDFDFSAGGGLSPASFTLDDDSDGTLSNTETFDVAAGSGYSVSENVPADWDQTSATCDDGSPVDDIDVSAGETVTCTFANRKRGRIVVVKDARPDDPQDFQFSAGGGLSPASFALDDDSDGTLSNTQTFDVAPGSGYSVSETSIPVGWQIINASCDDQSPANNIDVSAGETVTCTFDNSILYARPRGATPVRASLVLAYDECTAPSTEHGPPLAHPSCPVTADSPASNFLTVGTPDANERVAQSIGHLRFRVIGSPGGPPDSDVTVEVQITDVRRKADLSDYEGELLVGGSTTVRITDRLNGPGQNQAGTTVDIPLKLGAPVVCAATADASIGSSCTLNTTINAVVPGGVPEGKRAIWELGSLDVYDSGSDGFIHTEDDNTLFMKQGLFVP